MKNVFSQIKLIGKKVVMCLVPNALKAAMYNQEQQYNAIDFLGEIYEKATSCKRTNMRVNNLPKEGPEGSGQSWVLLRFDSIGRQCPLPQKDTIEQGGGQHERSGQGAQGAPNRQRSEEYPLCDKVRHFGTLSNLYVFIPWILILGRKETGIKITVYRPGHRDKGLYTVAGEKACKQQGQNNCSKMSRKYF